MVFGQDSILTMAEQAVDQSQQAPERGTLACARVKGFGTVEEGSSPIETVCIETISRIPKVYHLFVTIVRNGLVNHILRRDVSDRISSNPSTIQ